MRKLTGIIVAIFIALGGIAFASPASAATCTTSASNGLCGPYAYTPMITSAGGGDTYVNNNVWNPPPGFTGQLCQAGSATPCQTTTSSDPGHWSATANFTSQGGAVLSYPDTQQLYGNTVVDNYSSLTSSFTENLSGADSNTMEEAAYDIFMNNWANEVMIWVDTTPAQAQTLNGDTNLGSATIAGQNWTIYRNGGVGAETIFSLNGGNEQTGTVDLKAMISYLESHGMEKVGSTLSTIDFGPEFASTDGKFATYTQSCFTISENVANQPCGNQQAQAPTVTTSAATGVTSTDATLNGSVNPQGQPATYQFDYGTTASYGSSVPSPAGSAGSGTTAVSESQAITGLSAGTIYHYRIEATNATGTTFGADQVFTASAQAQAPVVTTGVASGLTSTGATLNGSVNPEGQATAYHFEYGATTAYGTSIPVPDGSAGSGTSNVAESAALTGLTAGSTYHYRIDATNATGTSTGADQSFTTPTTTTKLVGDGSIEGTRDSNVQGTAQAVEYKAVASGTSQTFHFYVDSSSTATAGALGIYHNSSGSPGALMKQVAFTPVAGKWNTVTFTGVSIVSGSNYWLAELGTNGVLSFRDKGSGAYSPGSQPGLTSLPATWSTGHSDWFSGLMSSYISG